MGFNSGFKGLIFYLIYMNAKSPPHSHPRCYFWQRCVNSLLCPWQRGPCFVSHLMYHKPIARRIYKGKDLRIS